MDCQALSVQVGRRTLARRRVRFSVAGSVVEKTTACRMVEVTQVPRPERLAASVGNLAGVRLSVVIAAGGLSIQLGVRAFFLRGCVGERGAGEMRGCGVFVEGEMACE